MQILSFFDSETLKSAPVFPLFQCHLDTAADNNFFQDTGFFELIGKVSGYKPFIFIAMNSGGAVSGSLMGVIQTNGSGPKAWLSRRAIIWGGPLLAAADALTQLQTAHSLINALKSFAKGRAIFIEFRNFFDTSNLRPVFEAAGFEYKPHLNYLVKTDEEAAVRKRMSSNRLRQIKSSLQLGAIIAEPSSEQEVLDFYSILQRLYREKVKKPLPGPDMFLHFRRSPLVKIFLVKHEGAIVGGIFCPIFRNRVIYEWYVCGDDGRVKGLNPSVLATWAPIEYGLRHGFDHFDFMGAGRPDEDYGVRDFKARFGGEEVCFGRYESVLNKPLYRIAKFGLRLYKKLK
jgi:serine/alanine adding enzyme